MYVRYKNGIGKINDYINNNYTQKFTYINNCGCAEFLEENQVIKASHNIIDLIEVGDILLLFDKAYMENYKAEVVLDSEDFKAIINYEQSDLLNLEYELITEEHIELLQIVTKEQFESMSYEVSK